ncbi:MAG: chorismate mutase [Fusobacteriaceae bacterium]|jgi:chorismate mutase|nr:chorismate mutase [Fusobacteriaceae bacterium]
MEKRFLVVDKSVLDEKIKKVSEVKEYLLKENNLEKALEKVSLAREEYEKLADKVFLFNKEISSSIIELLFILDHKAGILSKVLTEIANINGNILTISQEPPKDNRANVKIKIDISNSKIELKDILSHFKNIESVESVELESVE